MAPMYGRELSAYHKHLHIVPILKSSFASHAHLCEEITHNFAMLEATWAIMSMKRYSHSGSGMKLSPDMQSDTMKLSAEAEKLGS